MNPSPAEARMNDLTPKGATTTHALGATGNAENATVKPLAKHIISVELQMFFEKVTTGITDPPNEQYREAALSALRTEPTIHQLLPYFVQFVTERVTHDMKSDRKLMESMMDICEALFANESLYIEPYINSLCPPILTCMLAKQLGDNAQDQLSTYPLRDKAASIVGIICRQFGDSSHELKSRLARSFLKAFMDNTKPPATWYGAIIGLANMGVVDAIRYLLLPNVKIFEEFIRDEINGDGPKKDECQKCLGAILGALKKLKTEEVELLMGGKSVDLDKDGLRKKLTDDLGPLAANECPKPRGKKKVAHIHNSRVNDTVDISLIQDRNGTTLLKQSNGPEDRERTMEKEQAEQVQMDAQSVEQEVVVVPDHSDGGGEEEQTAVEDTQRSKARDSTAESLSEVEEPETPINLFSEPEGDSVVIQNQEPGETSGGVIEDESSLLITEGEKTTTKGPKTRRTGSTQNAIILPSDLANATSAPARRVNTVRSATPRTGERTKSHEDIQDHVESPPTKKNRPSTPKDQLDPPTQSPSKRKPVVRRPKPVDNPGTTTIREYSLRSRKSGG
ncbi:hypothetical protein H072_6346 [Dactylellina haptotyla CBS 200.50]|uniref:TAF6 C-terminal HEAT repeat domain-containing protein n=1 Tax=Dactylellina haptotyla (strain CBS 200.50) TaxID=1284197 RepID=S8AF71_DACHA|nr:hypothetical protein H072_6346 [Dactylellina haptotyla CBS 200.50]